VVPLYFARQREVVNRGGMLIPIYHDMPLAEGEKVERVMCRMRSLGCTFCTGAVISEATTIPEIIEELRRSRLSERQNRAIDHDQEGSMELKKREGYF
jgi:sulfate adenylyltransferase subunit 2